MTELERTSDDDEPDTEALHLPPSKMSELSTFDPATVSVQRIDLTGYTAGVAGKGPLAETLGHGPATHEFDVALLTIEPSIRDVVSRMVQDVAERYVGLDPRLLLSGDLRVDIYRVSSPLLRVADLRRHPVLYRADPRPERLAKSGAEGAEWELVRTILGYTAATAIELPGQSGPAGRDFLLKATDRSQLRVEHVGPLHEIAPASADTRASMLVAAVLEFVSDRFLGRHGGSG